MESIDRLRRRRLDTPFRAFYAQHRSGKTCCTCRYRTQRPEGRILGSCG